MAKAKLLSALRRGQKAVIKGYASEDVSQRIYDMGLLPGTQVEVEQKNILNGPICLCVDKNRCKLAIGKKEASCVLIELL